MEEMDVDDFRRVVDVDLIAPFIVSKAVIPGMIGKGHGKIINVCSMMSELGRGDSERLCGRQGRAQDAHTQYMLRIR